MAGYTRQSAAEILNGLDVTAPPLNAEFNKIEAAFDAAEGHSHDGSTGSGGPINLSVAVTGLLPVANGGVGGRHNTFATTSPVATSDTTVGYAVGSMWVNVETDRVYVCVDDTAGAAIWTELVLLQPGGIFYTENDATVDIGSESRRFRELHLAQDAFIDGSMELGGDLSVSSASASGSISAAGGFQGDLTGNVTGDLTGNVSGDVTSTGTSSFNNVEVTGTVMFGGAVLQNTGYPAQPTDSANKQYVDDAISDLIGGSGDALDTLNELAAALGDDPDFATTISNDVATRLKKAGGTMTGNLVMDAGATVTGIPAPAAGSHAVSLDYLNSRVGPLEDAQSNAVLAEEWATKAVDTVVRDGKYSARHHAVKASQSASAAGVSEDNADLSAQDASDSASAASASKTAAGDHAADALAYRDAAQTARDAAQAAQGLSEDARDAAQTAEANARQSEDDAYSYKQDAETAAGNALSSEEAAAASLTSFQEQYIGSLDVEPNQDLNGNPVSAGQLYLNTTDGNLYVYDGTNWIKSFYDPTSVAITGGEATLDTLVVEAGDLYIRNQAPTLYLDDTNSPENYRLLATAGSIEFRTDTEGDGSYEQISLELNTQSERAFAFGHEVWHAGNDGPLLKSQGPRVIGGYLEMEPYNSSYDDGSYFQSYYDGNNRRMRVQARDSTGSTTSLQFDVSGTFTTTGSVSSGGSVNAAGNFNAESVGPQITLGETDTNALGRMIMAGSDLYIQAANERDTDLNGTIRFSGLNAQDIGALVVRHSGGWRDIWHTGNDGTLLKQNENATVGKVLSIRNPNGQENGLQTNNDGQLQVMANSPANGEVIMTFDDESRNVGIGDTSPEDRLTIAGGHLNLRGGQMKNVGAILFNGGTGGDYLEYVTQQGLRFNENGVIEARVGPDTWFRRATRHQGGINTNVVRPYSGSNVTLGGELKMNGNSIDEINTLNFNGGSGSGQDYIQWQTGSGLNYYENGTHVGRFGSSSYLTNTLRVRTNDEVATIGGSNQIGSLIFARPNTNSTYDAGDTIGGSSLYTSNAAGDSQTQIGTGTWVCLGYSYGGSFENNEKVTLWQRIS